MSDGVAANLKLRADRDAMDESKRQESAATLCPLCGLTGCASAFCEISRSKAEQQAKAQTQAAAAGFIAPGAA